jgi:hypothetical protein
MSFLFAYVQQKVCTHDEERSFLYVSSTSVLGGPVEAILYVLLLHFCVYNNMDTALGDSKGDESMFSNIWGRRIIIDFSRNNFNTSKFLG